MVLHTSYQSSMYMYQVSPFNQEYWIHQLSQNSQASIHLRINKTSYFKTAFQDFSISLIKCHQKKEFCLHI